MTQPIDPQWREQIPDDTYEDQIERLDGLPEDGEERGHPTTATDVFVLISKQVA